MPATMPGSGGAGGGAGAGRLATQYYLPFVGQAAHDLQNLLLLRFDFRQAHRTLGVQVFAHHLAGPLRHVLEDLFAQVLGRALERDDQHFGLHFAQQQLDAAVVDVDDVIEHEHLVHDLLRHVVVVVLDVVHHRTFLLAAHEVEDFGGRAHPAQRGFLDVLVARQQLGEHVVQFAQRGRLHPVQRGDAQHHVVAQAVGEIAQDFAGLVALEVDQDGGDDLRVLVADQFGHRGGVHPLQAFDAGSVLAAQDARQQHRGLVVAQRLGQHLADVFVGVEPDRRIEFGLGPERGQHVDHLAVLDRLHGGHRRAQLEHFARAEEFHHLGRFGFAQRQHQDRRLLYTIVIHSRLPML
jgi:hypothetical protein